MMGRLHDTKELQLLTYDLIVLGQEAWKESHLATPPIKFKSSGRSTAHSAYHVGQDGGA